MIIDLHSVDSDPFKENSYDVCICGAGVAGITLALKLSDKLKVVLLEAGGYEYSADSQSIYKGKSIGQEYFKLHHTRFRWLGGSSNVWGGWCRPLDNYDYKSKLYLKYSGWPIGKSDLDPYINEAKSILLIADNSNKRDRNVKVNPLYSINYTQELDEIKFWWSGTGLKDNAPKPVRFGRQYRHELNDKQNLECYLNANVVDIILNDDLSSVKEFKVRDYNNKMYSVSAKTFVLAAGGIENPRILLNSNRQQKEGIGNKYGLVGRFFSEHPHYTIGNFKLADHVKEYYQKNWISNTLLDWRNWSFFAPSVKMMLHEKILNFSIHFRPHEPLDGFNFKEWLRSVICSSVYTKDMIHNITGKKIFCKPGEGTLLMASEQSLSLKSRITLDSELDRFGNKRILLDWRINDVDKYTIKRSAVRFGEIFAALDLGRVRLSDWLLHDETDYTLPGVEEDEVGGNHHMCTTRMGVSPQEGVVDSNLRVFGFNNFFIAGSSVFSTGGHANPTFTIVQLTLRLVDYLNNNLKK